MHLKAVNRYTTMYVDKLAGSAANLPESVEQTHPGFPVTRGMVRKEGLEPSRVTPLEPKSSASTSSATLAMNPAPERSEQRNHYGWR